MTFFKKMIISFVIGVVFCGACHFIDHMHHDHDGPCPLPKDEQCSSNPIGE